MYLLKQVKFAFFFALALLLSYNSKAQESFCALTSPDNVVLSEDSNSQSILSWDAKEDAIAYRVVVLDNALGSILFDQTTPQESISLGSIFFTPDVYVGIASVCVSAHVGGFEYFAPAAGINIFVQDIVMQMEGEPEPRILECDVARTQLINSTFDGGFSGNAEVSPPSNSTPGHEVQGALVYVDYYRDATDDLFAQSTTLALASGSILNAADQFNVNHQGLVYKYVEPQTSGLYSITYTGNDFDYTVNTNTPLPEAYRIEVGLRFCYNVNKIEREEGYGGGSFGLASQEINDIAVENRLERVTERLKLSVYPNPALDQIQLSHQAERVIIRNSHGQVVLQLEAVAAHNAIQISDWQPGVYFLETIAVDGTRKTIRFIKN